MNLVGVATFFIFFVDFSKFSTFLIFFNEFLTHNLLPPIFTLITRGFNALREGIPRKKLLTYGHCPNRGWTNSKSFGVVLS